MLIIYCCFRFHFLDDIYEANFFLRWSATRRRGEVETSLNDILIVGGEKTRKLNYEPTTAIAPMDNGKLL